MASEQPISYRPIGVIHSRFRSTAGMPIQGAFAPESEGVVEVFAEFEEGLRDVEKFTHVILLYSFHRVGRARLSCIPYLDDEEHGVFATRAPCRPNPIGLSIVRVVSRKGRMITVREVDVLDGTPLLDIKPYFPSCDCRSDAGSGWLRDADESRFSKGADERFSS